MPTVNRVQQGQMQSRLPFRVVIALLMLGALELGGCGVRGPLETPQREKAETGNATPGTPGQPAPHKSSILDPLIR